MNHKRILLGVVLAELGMAGAAQAATYSNTVEAGTPFGITLDSGSPAWEAPYAVLEAHDTGVVEGSSSYYPNYGDWTIVTEVVPAQVGVDGAINIYKERTERFYDYSYQDQTFDASYSAGLSVPSAVPQTYILAGQLQNQIGAGLVNAGQGYVGFSMSLFPQFAEPYVVGSGSAKLSFKFGMAPGTWSYSFEKTFDLNPGTISLEDYVGDYYWSYNDIDLSGTAYFEATYSIDGMPGVVVDASSLNLHVWGGVSEYSSTWTHDVIERQLVLSEPIPALAVPEPQTYAMMLAGLSLVGFATRRRTRTAV